ncbi:MAG: DUF3817 domain-containing protein [Ghiorsea sp.]
MLKLFRIFSMIEGLSLISLIFIAMPAKYQFGVDLVHTIGPIHGFLWLAYLPFMEVVSRKENWPIPLWNLAVLTSVVPFGCFFLEKRLRQQPVFTTKQESVDL